LGGRFFNDPDALRRGVVKPCPDGATLLRMTVIARSGNDEAI
jgi:hypothetical protein